MESSHHDDLAVGLDGNSDRLCNLCRPGSKIRGRRDSAVGAEGRVVSAVGVQPRDADVQVRTVGRRDAAGDDDLAVGLDRHAVRLGVVIGAPVEGDGALAGGVEGGVERAVYGVQPRDGEVVGPGGVGLGKAGDDDFAVGLDRHAARLVVIAAEDDGAPALPAELPGAVGVEGGVVLAVACQPHDGEVPVLRRKSWVCVQLAASDDDLAIGLDRHAARLAW